MDFRSKWIASLAAIGIAAATAALSAATAATSAGSAAGPGPAPPNPDSGARAAPTPADRASAVYEEGRALTAAGRHEDAAAAFEKALAIDPSHGDARTALGWARYRLGRFGLAADAFEEAVRREPSRADAWTGLGYARLQNEERARARAAFARALVLAPRDTEATKGLALLTLREGRAAEAVDLFRQVLAAAPGDAEARAGLSRALTAAGVLKDRTLRPPVARPPLADGSPPPLAVRVRAGGRYFEVREASRWRPILVKGVNLGVALPGKFPAEFPEDEGLYRDWLGKMRAMNTNVVRVYTLLPPAFYAALAAENRAHPDAPLRLVQGVWVELPPGNDFGSPEWGDDYAAEIRRVIDAVHGNIEVAPRPGHASGRYDADVSAWLLGFLLGREWEPYAVEEYENRAPDASGGRPAGGAAFEGRYIRTTPAPLPGPEAAGQGREAVRTEAWIASTLETAAAHLALGYGESWPLSFTNWPTLDPLHHPTEATRAEEDAVLTRLGRPRPPDDDPVYDNDAWSVDAMRMDATKEWPAGLFVSYHAYPYFPDFMILDPGYLAARDAEGPDAYAGYLRDLVRHHAGRPLLIAEFGVPSSRGVAHRQPQGFDHGGHDESAQARIDARLYRAIRETGCAGGVLFSWMDEWFKHNWLFQSLEVPRERKPLWLNALDPEEHFGVMAADPASAGIVLDGKTDDWKGIAPYYAPRDGPIRALYATADEAYLYLRLDTTPSGPAPASAPTYWIGIDTYDRARGDRRLPGLASPVRIPGGLEFAIRLGSDPRLLVDAPYDIGSHRNSGPYASVANDEGRFVSMQAEIRMERIGRDGKVYPAERNDMSPLRRAGGGRASPEAGAGAGTLADWCDDPAAGTTELRIPWGLLNVTDPSARRVVHQTREHRPPIDTVVTEGFVFDVVAARAGRGAPEDERPRPDEAAPVYAWPTWEAPRYRLRLKPAYESMKKEYGRLGPLAP